MNNSWLISDLGRDRKAILGCIEILSCPSIRILPEFQSSKEAHSVYSMEMESLLSQHAKEFLRSSSTEVELSLEYSYVTEPVQNQPYAAKIRSFIVIRIIGDNLPKIKELMSDTIQRFESILRAESYFFQSYTGDDYFKIIDSIKVAKTMAVLREDRIHSLQSPTLATCLSFDRISTTDYSRKRLLNELIHFPGCYVSFQLIPISFTGQEVHMITNCAQLLNNMVRGISDQGGPISISYTSAIPEAETYSYYADRCSDAVFRYNIVVFGESEGVSNISQAIIQEFSGCALFRTSLKRITLDGQSIGFTDNPCSFPWIISEEVDDINQTFAVQQQYFDYSVFHRLIHSVSAEEAAMLFHFPIGDESIGEGLIVNESHHSRRFYNKDIINSGDFAIGKIRSSLRGDEICMRFNDLTRHMLVTGTPGSGKTTFLEGLIDQLWHSEKRIPFLIIEPAKNEYRALISRIPDLQVFTPGKSNISPFVYNPFLPPRNVRLETFKPSLMTAFSAAVSMQSPLDKIFEDTINNCYGNHHWFDSYTSDSGASVFNIADFIACFQSTFESIGYSGEAKNIGKAGTVRLKGFEHLFDFYNSIPIEDLMSKPTLIELSAIESSEQKALIIALILLSILNYVNANKVGLGDLSNILLLEEAHVLMDATSGNRGGEADPAAIAQKLIIRMLAEIRSLGVGIILADQSPRKVGTDVVALTDAKLTFRLVEEADRQIIAASTGLNESQSARLSKLKCGEAMFFFGRLDEPEEILVTNFREKFKVQVSISDEDLARKTTYWKNHSEMLKPYPECRCSSQCSDTCDFRIREMGKEIARRIHSRKFSQQAVSGKQIVYVLSHLDLFISPELLNEHLTDQLVSCVKVNLIRMLHYNNRIIMGKSADKPVTRPFNPTELNRMEQIEVRKHV